MKRRPLIALGAAVLSGCSILPERPPLNYFGLIVPPIPARAGKRPLSSLRLNSPTVAPPYDDTRFIVIGEGSRFYESDINRFVSRPSEMIGAALRQALQAAGPWTTVLSPNSIALADWQMTVYVSEFCVIANPAPGHSVIAMEVTVTRSSTNALAFHQVFRAERPLAEQKPQALMQSFSIGLTAIIEQLTTALSRRFG